MDSETRAGLIVAALIIVAAIVWFSKMESVEITNPDCPAPCCVKGE